MSLVGNNVMTRLPIQNTVNWAKTSRISIFFGMTSLGQCMVCVLISLHIYSNISL